MFDFFGNESHSVIHEPSFIISLFVWEGEGKILVEYTIKNNNIAYIRCYKK